MCYVSSKSSPYLSLHVHVHKYSSLQYLCPWGQSLYIWNMWGFTPRTMVTHVTLQSVFLSFPDQQAGLQICTYLYVKANIVCRYGTEKINNCYLQLRVWSVHTVKGTIVLVNCLRLWFVLEILILFFVLDSL